VFLNIILSFKSPGNNNAGSSVLILCRRLAFDLSLDSIRRSIPAGAGKIWTVLQLLFPEFVA
jgi:hypothetical protein